MKKIVVFLLIVAFCVPALFSCNPQDGGVNLPSDLPSNITDGMKPEEPSPLQAVSDMYSVSQPTKVSAETLHILVEDILELKSSYEIVTGYVDSLPASVYKASIQELRSIEEGGQNEEIKDLIKSYSRTIEVIEGKGSRTNGGDWNPDAEVWEIGRGRMAINLDEALVENVNYDKHVLTFDIPEENVAAVLGESIGSDVDGVVSVTIVDDGAVVTSIELSYYVKENAEANLARSEMHIKVVYTYDIERITIE